MWHHTALSGPFPLDRRDRLPPAGDAALLTEAPGVPVTYRDVPYEQFRQLPLPNAAAIADMLEFTRRHPDVTPSDVDRARTLHPGMRTFGQWLKTARGSFASLL